MTRPTQPPLRKRATPPTSPTIPLPSPPLHISPPPPSVRSYRHQGSAMGSGYNPYMNMGMMGGGGYPGQPQSAVGSIAPGQSQVQGQGQMGSMGSMGSGGELKQFDAGKMKAGRLGHYGYLEGRELAGPPPGYLPAGVKPEHVPQSSISGAGGPGAPSQSQGTSAYHTPTQYAPTQYQHSQAPTQYPQQGQYQAPPRSPGSVAGSQALSLSQSAWGNQNDIPRARYDGTSNAGRYIQADLDTPYPRLKAGGMSSSATRYDGRQEPINGNGYRDAFGYSEAGAPIDGRLGKGHRRMREGKV